VSDGGGAEGVTEEEARAAIASGRAFVPEAAGGLFFRATASTYGLTPHLFYREAAVFLGELRRRDEAAFRRFLIGVEDARALDESFLAAYGEPLAQAWKSFVSGTGAAAPK
jgi:hypothetical protein